jgi:hypothetical protein
MIFCVFAMAAGLAIWTCSKKSNPSGPGGGDIGGGNTSWNYTISGNTIIIQHPADTVTYSYCDTTKLVTETDTESAYTEIDTFSLNGNTMTVNGIGDSGTPVVFTRVGSGSGVQGQWQGQIYGENITVQVTSSTITFSQFTTYCYADDWMSFDWAYDSIGFNGTAAELSCTQVRITGSTTGEQVTITWNSNGDMTYTSNKAGHAAYTYYENPTSCPDDDTPSWYYTDFFGQNYTGIPKRAVRPSIPRVKKHPVRW